ncbi:DMT family transporter [Pseudonocardia sp. C8]|uniref:DMT family transporter n=1 Tax=Pseudonocardia sp. C8 TaxID=2762759 RepID=UPI0016426709|nr:DMT family transporter [Pseudonocardia sp. C8]MBC3189647.1 DMT family transporter [Pseudonocardia sp. C8]
MERMTGRAWALFAAVSVLWGVPYLFIGLALRDGVGPLWTAAGRVVLAAAVLAPVAVRRRALLRGRGGRLAALAVIEIVVPFSLIPLGELTVASGLAGVLIATEPMFVLLVGLLLGSRTRPGPVTVVGLAIGFTGVVVLLGVAGAGPGVPLIVTAAACYGVGAVLVERWFSDVPAVVVVAGVLAVAAPVLSVLAVVAEPVPSPSAVGVGAVAALGLGATAAGLVSFFALIGLAGPDRAALITYVAPVVAVVCGALLLAEPVGPRTVGGTVLILAGAWLATRTGRR